MHQSIISILNEDENVLFYVESGGPRHDVLGGSFKSKDILKPKGGIKTHPQIQPAMQGLERVGRENAKLSAARVELATLIHQKPDIEPRTDVTQYPVRPERYLTHEPLHLKAPEIDKVPKAPVDAVLVLGMGPVRPVLRGATDSRRVVTDFDRMRHNAHATVEISTRGYVKPDGVIIPSGRATANADAVRDAYNQTSEQNPNTPQREIDGKPHSEEEVTQVMQTPEAKLMHFLIDNVRAKNTAPTRQNRVEVFDEDKAPNTLGNYTLALNELDRRSRKKNGTLFEGTLMVMTSEHGHMARSMEVARLLGIQDQIVPITSQQVLRHYDYSDPLYQPGGEEQVTKSYWNEQMLVRSMREIPEFVLPELAVIADDQRLVSVMSNLEEIYGKEAFETNGLGNFSTDEPDVLRERLRGIDRVHPVKEEWLQNDSVEVAQVTAEYAKLTDDWLTREESKE